MAAPQPLEAGDAVPAEVIRSRITFFQALSIFYPEAKYDSGELADTCNHLLRVFFSSLSSVTLPTIALDLARAFTT